MTRTYSNFAAVTLSQPAAGFLLAGVLLAGAGVASVAQAAAFPDKPIKLVVPYSAGATTDTLGRRIGTLMSALLGVPVFVDNKPGANAIIGATAVARSEPDGHTLLFCTDSSNVLNPLLYPKLSYSAKDLVPIALLSDLPVVLVVSSSLPAKSLEEFVTYGRANPGKVHYGSTGNGGTFHLAGELFAQQAGMKMTHVPYKGGAPAITAMLAGEIQALFGVAGSNLPQIKAGKLRALGVASNTRLPALAETPTFAEQGWKDFSVIIRYGLCVPRGTPKPAIDKLVGAVNHALADPEFRKTFDQQGFVMPAQTGPAHFQALVESDRKLWTALIKRQNITLD